MIFSHRMLGQRLLQQKVSEHFVAVLGHFVLLALATVVLKRQNNGVVRGDEGAITDGLNCVLRI